MLLIIIGTGCEKDEEKNAQLPPITQNGAGTFGCLVNGEIWNADPLLFGSPLGASNNQWEDKRWVIDAVGTNYTFTIEICRDSVINGSSLLIGTEDESCSNATIHKKSSQSGDFTYHTTNQDMGKVTITRYDTIQKIISGSARIKEG